MITFQQFDENARAALKLLKTTSKIIGGRKVGSLGRVKYKALTTGPSTSAVGLHRQKINASQAAAIEKQTSPDLKLEVADKDLIQRTKQTTSPKLQ